MSLKQDLLVRALELGADAVRIARVKDYEEVVPTNAKPSYLADGMKSIIIFHKHLLTGAVVMKDVTTQSVNSHLSLDMAEEVGFELAEWLEERGYLGVPVSPEYADLNIKSTGAGLLDLKWTGEFSGLGHVGLNLNFLSPEYGSRVYLCALLTDAEMEPDRPLEQALCPGLRCGRCAVVCPPKAIPLEAKSDDSVNEYRNLDQPRCSSAAMRIGISSLFNVTKKLKAARKPLDVDAVLNNRYWLDYWIATNSKRGAFAACFECMYVCPVGSKDVKTIFKTPIRQRDIATGKVTHIKQDGWHRLEFFGPPKDREGEFMRDRDFDEVCS